MEKTRIAVIGLGGIAQLVHLPILSELRNVEIVAVADIQKSKLESIKSKYGIKKGYTNYKELLENEEIDAVVITTPTNTHVQIAIDCLKAKKHLLVEKPIALSYKEAKLINDTAKKNNCMVMVGMNLRFRPDAMLIKSLINSGEFGDLFYVNCRWIRKQSSDEKWFMKKNESGGGVLIDLGIVLFDLAIWLLDFPPIKTISVKTFNQRTKSVEDSAVGFIRFKNSSVLSFEVSWSLHSDQDSFSLSAFGTEGTAHLNPLKAYRKVESTRIDYTPPQAGNPKHLFRKSFENEINHFIGAVRGINPLLSSSEDALIRMKLLEGIYKSAELNKEIEL
ncbi:MAG: Gfo/Idh/MocA family oxidoreductase [Melioribacteraceae bacterium]|nr:MAG: Gfo/Idh/MocA family oxidoreductase [Melioribacteraceae bacterium]